MGTAVVFYAGPEENPDLNWMDCPVFKTPDEAQDYARLILSDQRPFFAKARQALIRENLAKAQPPGIYPQKLWLEDRMRAVLELVDKQKAMGLEPSKKLLNEKEWIIKAWKETSI